MSYLLVRVLLVTGKPFPPGRTPNRLPTHHVASGRLCLPAEHCSPPMTGPNTATGRHANEDQTKPTEGWSARHGPGLFEKFVS